jgi:nucleoside-diphosphate-sugar epimerase
MPASTQRTATIEGTRRCLISGSTGYVGSRIKQALEADGWHITELGRNPGSSSNVTRFQLGEAIAPEQLTGHSALVHCAYDFRQISWDDIAAVNVRGSELLLRAASEAGVKQIVLISSISAYDGCRSLYGRAKLEIENVTASLGGWIIRPGLVYGNAPGAVFGRLVEKARKSRFIPLPGGGRQRQYLVHDADLCAAVCRCVQSEKAACTQPVTVAHEEVWTFRELLLEIGRSLGTEVRFVPVPWQLVWAGLRLGEKLHLPLQFRSDSLVSLVHQNPNPAFNSFETVGVKCRPFESGTLTMANLPSRTSRL